MDVFLRDEVPENSVITFLEHGSFFVVLKVSVRTSGLFFFGSKPKFGRGIKTCLMTKFILKKLSRACWRGEPLFREGADTSLLGLPCKWS